jgi:hypothetical protein
MPPSEAIMKLRRRSFLRLAAGAATLHEARQVHEKWL